MGAFVSFECNFGKRRGNYSCDKVVTIEKSADKPISDGTEITKQ